MTAVIAKPDFVKIRNLSSAKDTVERMRKPATDQEKIPARDTSDKEHLVKIQGTLTTQQ